MKKFIMGLVIGGAITISGSAFAVVDTVTAQEFMSPVVQTIFGLLHDEIITLRGQLAACQGVTSNQNTQSTMSEPVLGASSAVSEAVIVVNHEYVDGTPGNKNLLFSVTGDFDHVKVDLWTPAGHNISGALNPLTPDDVKNGVPGKYATLGNMPTGHYEWEVTAAKNGLAKTERGTFEVI